MRQHPKIELKKIGFFEDQWLKLLKGKYNMIAKALNDESNPLLEEERKKLYIKLMDINNEISFYD